jgi:predicted HTH transcriptional regulator
MSILAIIREWKGLQSRELSYLEAKILYCVANNNAVTNEYLKHITYPMYAKNESFEKTMDRLERRGYVSSCTMENPNQPSVGPWTMYYQTPLTRQAVQALSHFRKSVFKKLYGY